MCHNVRYSYLPFMAVSAPGAAQGQNSNFSHPTVPNSGKYLVKRLYVWSLKKSRTESYFIRTKNVNILRLGPKYTN